MERHMQPITFDALHAGGIPLRVQSKLVLEDGITRGKEELVTLSRERLLFTDLEASITMANEYGSVKIASLPSNWWIFGVQSIIQLTGTGGVTNVNALEMAVGYAATTSATNANQGADDLIFSQNPVAGRLDISRIAEARVGSTDGVYLNYGLSGIGADGTVRASGGLDVVYLEMEAFE